MWRTIGFAALTAGILAFVPADVTAQKKNQAVMEVADPATDKDYKQIQTVKEMSGKLASINSMSVTFRLDIPHMEPNPYYRPSAGNNNAQNQQMQNIYRQQAQIMATKNPYQQQIKMQQLMATMQKQQYQQMLQANNPNNQPYRMAHQYKDYELDLSEKVVIRKMVLETEYDEKGNLKTYTKQELADLKGKDSTKPGYKAKIEDMQSSQHVTVRLAMPKKTKPASDVAKAEDKAADKNKAADKDKAADKAKVADKADQVVDKAKVADKADKADDKAKEEVVKPIITMVIILDPLDANLTTDTPPPAKKKKANN